MQNYEYTTHALIIKKEIDGLKILVTAKLPDHVQPEDTLDTVLDALLEMTDKLPFDNDSSRM